MVKMLDNSWLSTFFKCFLAITILSLWKLHLFNPASNPWQYQWKMLKLNYFVIRRNSLKKYDVSLNKSMDSTRQKQVVFFINSQLLFDKLCILYNEALTLTQNH